MKIEDVIHLDYRKNENKEVINSILTSSIKFFKEYEGKKVPQMKVEEFIGFICRKFQVSVQWINVSFLPSGENMYSVSVLRSDTREWLGTIYACCMLELLNKLAIKLFWEVKTKKIPKRKQKEEESED